MIESPSHHHSKWTPAIVMSPTLMHGNSKNDTGQERRERKKEEKENTRRYRAELGLQLIPSKFSLKIHGYQCSSNSIDSLWTPIVYCSMAIRNVELPHEWSSTHECYRILGTHARVPPPPDTQAREQQKRNQKKRKTKKVRVGARTRREAKQAREKKKVQTVTADLAK